MSRGKYKNAAAAREARESAIAEAASAKKRQQALEAENADLRDQVAQLRIDLAAGVSDNLTRMQRRAEESEEKLRAARALLDEVRSAMTRNYEHAVRILLKQGFPLDLAADVVDAETLFFVGDELLTNAEIEMDWAVNKGRVAGLRRKSAPYRKVKGNSPVIDVQRQKHNAAYHRVSQGF